MKTIYIIKGMLLCCFIAVLSPLLMSKENPEAKLVIQSLSIDKKKDISVFKIIVDNDQETEYLTSFNIIEPSISMEARNSKKKDILAEFLEDAIENIDSVLKADGHGKLNAQDLEYMKYYRAYSAWRKAKFNTMYVVTSKPNSKGDFSIIGALTAYQSPMGKEPYFETKALFSGKQLDTMQWKGISPGTLARHIEHTIARMDAEDITALPTKLSRMQKDELERNQLRNAVSLRRTDIDIYHIPMKHFEVVHAALVAPSPEPTMKAILSKKKDIIMEAIEEGEVDIPSYIKTNGGGSMNIHDHAFARYYSMLLKYEEGSFKSAFIVTKRNVKTIEIVGLLVGGVCIIPNKDSLENIWKTYLAKELKVVGTRNNNISLMEFLQNIIVDSSCQKVYP